jgi:diguanylate cyclase (GGDEF)-like protein
VSTTTLILSITSVLLGLTCSWLARHVHRLRTQALRQWRDLIIAGDTGSVLGRRMLPLLDSGPRHPIVVSIVNVDEFTRIVQLGHPQARQLLTLMAGRFNAQAQRTHGLCYRLGRDEFAFIWNNRSLADVTTLVDAVRATLTDPFTLTDGDRYYQVTVTIGVGTVHDERHSGTSELLRRANIALQHAKRNGPDHSIIWRSDLPELVRGRDREPVYGLVEWSDSYQPSLIVGRSVDEVQRAAVRLLRRFEVQYGPIRSEEDRTALPPAPDPDHAGTPVDLWLQQLHAATTNPRVTIYYPDEVHTRFTQPADTVGALRYSPQPLSPQNIRPVDGPPWDGR